MTDNKDDIEDATVDVKNTNTEPTTVENEEHSDLANSAGDNNVNRYADMVQKAKKATANAEAEQQAKSDKRAKWMKGLAAVSDLGAGIANLYGTTKGALPTNQSSAVTSVNNKYEQVLKDRATQAQKDRDMLIAGQQADLKRAFEVQDTKDAQAFTESQAKKSQDFTASQTKDAQGFQASQAALAMENANKEAALNRISDEKQNEMKNNTSRYIANLKAETAKETGLRQERIAAQKKNADPNRTATSYEVGDSFTDIPRGKEDSFNAAVMSTLGGSSINGTFFITSPSGDSLMISDPHDALIYLNKYGTTKQKQALQNIVKKYSSDSTTTSSKTDTSFTGLNASVRGN